MSGPTAPATPQPSQTEQVAQPDRAGWERWATCLLCAVAAALVLPGLGAQPLWQDEAQTALVSRTILDGGLPRGTDGTNYFSQELGKEYAADHLWRWHTWLSFYLTAASFALLDPSTFSARLPFALLGIACTALCVGLARRLWGDPRAALLAGTLSALSVPLLIFSRQCRYFTLAAALGLGGLWAYASLRRGNRAPTACLFACAFLLFHAHYVYAATLLATLGLHAVLFERDRLPAVVGVTLAVTIVNLPWIAWFADVRPGGDRYFASVLDASKWLAFSTDYVRLLGRFLPGWLLAVPLVVACVRWRRGEAPFAIEPALRSGVALVVLYAAVSVALLAALSPLMFYRYLAPVAPALFVLGGLLLATAFRLSKIAGVACLAVWLAGSGLERHWSELTTRLDGPVSGILAFLDERAAPGDAVAISYGDLPLKFYTPHRVIGGLTGEPLDDLASARWLIPRHHGNTGRDREVRRAILAEVQRDPSRFRRHRLGAPDLPFENREDPVLRRVRPAPTRVPRVLVFERLP